MWSKARRGFKLPCLCPGIRACRSRIPGQRQGNLNPLRGDSGVQVPVGKRRIFEAKLVGQHKETDLALLKIDEGGLPTLSLATQQRPQVGELVFAIGSPEGLQNSLTMGVVSAVAR